MEETHAALLAACEHELEVVYLIQGPPDGTQEPEFRWLADPPGKSVVQAHARQHPPHEREQGRMIPVWSAEIPEPPTRRRPVSWLVQALAHQVEAVRGEPLTAGWDRSSDLAEALIAHQVHRAIFADFHRLITPRGSMLVQELAWLVSFWKVCMKGVPFLAVGEEKAMGRLTCANGSIARRFHRLRLPGEAKEVEDPEARAQLRKRLGMEGQFLV